jgi:hypothetical protein
VDYNLSHKASGVKSPAWYDLGMLRLVVLCALILTIAVGVLFPIEQGLLLAQEGIVPGCPVEDPNCSDPYSPDNYGTCELIALANNVIGFFIGMISVFGAIIMVYAGYLLVSSQGNATQVKKSKEMFTNVLIGMLILFSAFLVVNTVLSMLVGSESSLMNWNSIECSYANKTGEPFDGAVALGKHVNGLYLQSGWTVISGGGGRYSYGVGGVGGGGGSCAVVTDPSNACHPSKLSCFGNAQNASKVCNLESSGGQVRAVSGTDVCKDGYSFSGGLFQINILANHNMITGCTNNFFKKTGDSAQGACLNYKTNSNNVRYCAVRNCEITNVAVYDRCMSQIMNVNTNLQIACRLYRDAGGWQPWITSARACGVN